jgi:hypothetical protein
MVMDKFTPSERRNDLEIMTAPASSGGLGWGDWVGAGSRVDEDRPRFYTATEMMQTMQMFEIHNDAT